MKSATHVISGFIFLMNVIFSSDSFAQSSLLDTSTVMAVVPVSIGDNDRSVYKRLDRLVPDLRKMSRDKIIKLECRYAGSALHEKDVLNAYQIAARVEKYLRVQHKLELDLWITIRMAEKQTKPASVITIAVLADDIKRLNSLPVETGIADGP